MPARLYLFELSHPSQMARLALQMKDVPFEERELPAGFHPALLRLSGFQRGTVPALKLEDGRRLQSTLEITRVLDELAPGPPVLHPSPEVTEAEHWAERELQMSPRRMFRWASVDQLEVREWVSRLSGLPAPGVAARLGVPIAKSLANKVGADAEAVQRELRLLPERLDRVDELLASGVIGGETFMYPWIEQVPLRLYDGEKLAARLADEEADVLIVESPLAGTLKYPFDQLTSLESR